MFGTLKLRRSFYFLSFFVNHYSDSTVLLLWSKISDAEIFFKFWGGKKRLTCNNKFYQNYIIIASLIYWGMEIILFDLTIVIRTTCK